jgi:hypothetical protein
MRAALYISGIISALVAAFVSAERPAFGQARENVLALPPVEELTATRERPLFAVSRRPPPIVIAPKQHDQTRAPIKLPFELIGIVVSGQIRMALLHDKDTDEDIKVAPGAVAGDWRVESVANRSVILRASDRRVRLWLVDFKPPPGVNVRTVGENVDGIVPAPPPPGGTVEEIMPTAASRPAAQGQSHDGSPAVTTRPDRTRVVRARATPDD